MSVDIIQEQLKVYKPQSQQEEENALKEITQDVVLSALSRAEFFSVAKFQGGTCLRILYGLNRFSEDLDFSLIEPSSSFEWEPYLRKIHQELKTYGYQLEIQDKSKAGEAVHKTFLKEDSIGNALVFNHLRASSLKKIKIKLEVDTNPPKGAVTEQKYIDFPVTVPVVADDLPSLFAGKSHALLCRPWEKGRDWYDFNWYVSKKIAPRFELLSAALDQLGPWKGKELKIDKAWYLEQMKSKINRTNWEKQKKDVEPFLKPVDRDLLKHWGVDFFLDRLRKLQSYLK